MRNARHRAALCCGRSALLAAGCLAGQQAAPTDYKPVSEKVLANIHRRE